MSPSWNRPGLHFDEGDLSSIRWHLNTLVESSLTLLVKVAPADLELPELAVLDAAYDDDEYRRLQERAKIALDRVLDRVDPVVGEHVQELARAERERADRLALVAFRLALVALMKPTPPTG